MTVPGCRSAHPGDLLLEVQGPACALPCRRFTPALADDGAWLGGPLRVSQLACFDPTTRDKSLLGRGTGAC